MIYPVSRYTFELRITRLPVFYQYLIKRFILIRGNDNIYGFPKRAVCLFPVCCVVIEVKEAVSLWDGLFVLFYLSSLCALQGFSSRNSIMRGASGALGDELGLRYVREVEFTAPIGLDKYRDCINSSFEKTVFIGATPPVSPS